MSDVFSEVFSRPCNLSSFDWTYEQTLRAITDSDKRPFYSGFMAWSETYAPETPDPEQRVQRIEWDHGDGYEHEWLSPDDPEGWQRINIDGRWFTYWLYNEQIHAPIYIGMTNNIFRRLTEHSKQKSWWPLVYRIIVDCHETEIEAYAEEARLIQRCQPTFNVAGLGRKFARHLDGES
jgi:hypothetical protein